MLSDSPALMHISQLLISLTLLTPGATALVVNEHDVTKEQPHIVLALVDDWGWRDGPAALRPGNGLVTPTMDRMVVEGVTFNRMYAFRYCSPTRSSILSGRLPFHVNQINLKNNQRGGGIHRNMTTLADKMKTAGYTTHLVGKWHAGMSHPRLVPGARGFDESLGYLAGSEDHWLHTDGGPTCGSKNKTAACCVDMFNTTQPVLDAKARYTGVYNGFIFTERAVEIIRRPRTAPMFLYLAWHNCHHPMQVPDGWEELYPAATYPTRRTYQAMVSFVDAALKNVTTALGEAGMWDNTVLVVSSDNGGPSLTDLDTSNNFPLRGGKYSLFDGGMRINFFVGGGYIPEAQRGRTVDGLAHVTDLYATFCALAGVSPEDSNRGVPNVDSVDIWPLVTGANTTSPRMELPLSIGPPGDDGCSDATGPSSAGRSGALIVGRYKLIVGTTCPAHWAGPDSPNGTAESPFMHKCGDGCLFDLLADPGEHKDLAADSAHAATFATLQERIGVLREEVFQTPYDASPMTPEECASPGVRGVLESGVWAPWQ
eukprot:m.9413 g.9413  ORF g.9413 m.9413 type:complete len:541 (-) comp4173_c0_seq2:103-1725(-)